MVYYHATVYWLARVEVTQHNGLPVGVVAVLY